MLVELFSIFCLLGTFFFLVPFLVGFFVEDSPYDIELIFMNFCSAVLFSLLCCLVFSVLFGFSLFMTIGAGVLVLLLFSMALMPGADASGDKDKNKDLLSFNEFKNSDNKSVNFVALGLTEGLSMVRDIEKTPLYSDLSESGRECLNSKETSLEIYKNNTSIMKYRYPETSLGLYYTYSSELFDFIRHLVTLFFWSFAFLMSCDFSHYFKSYSFCENISCPLVWPLFCLVMSFFLMCLAVVVIDVCKVYSGALVGGSWKEKTSK